MCDCAPGADYWARYLAVLCFLSLPTLILFLLPVILGGGSVWIPLSHGFVSYPFHEMLSSHRCRCSLAVILYLLFCLLGIAAFAVFSNICMVLGGDFHRHLERPLCCCFVPAVFALFLYSTDEWNHLVLVFLHLAYFTDIIPSTSIHVVANGRICFLLMAE